MSVRTKKKMVEFKIWNFSGFTSFFSVLFFNFIKVHLYFFQMNYILTRTKTTLLYPVLCANCIFLFASFSSFCASFTCGYEINREKAIERETEWVVQIVYTYIHSAVRLFSTWIWNSFLWVCLRVVKSLGKRHVRPKEILIKIPVALMLKGGSGDGDIKLCERKLYFNFNGGHILIDEE